MACFIKGTHISIPKGYTSIEKLKVGDIVLSHNQIFVKVLANTHHIEDRLICLNGQVTASPEHPFLTDHGFIPIGKLKIGDIVFYDRLYVKVTSLKIIDKKTEVYNLSVEKPHTFIANGFAVHNKSSINSFDWRIYADGGSGDPTVPYGNQDTTGQLPLNTSLVEIRYNVEGSVTAFGPLSTAWSLDQTTWNDLNSPPSPNTYPWVWTTGSKDGNTIAGLLLTSSNSKGIYATTGTKSYSYLGGTYTEFDLSIKPTPYLRPNTTYYFAVYASGTIVSNNTGYSYASIKTASNGSFFQVMGN